MSTEVNKETCQEVEQAQGETNVDKLKSKKNKNPPPPKLPPNAFFLFKADVSTEFKGYDEGEMLSKVSKRWRYLDEEEVLKYEKRAEEARARYFEDVREYEEKYGKIERKKRRPPPTPPLSPETTFLKEVGEGAHDFDVVREHYEGMQSDYEYDYKSAVKQYNKDLKAYKKEFGKKSTNLEEIILSDDSDDEDEGNENNEDEEGEDNEGDEDGEEGENNEDNDA